jgi:hypothetical protein
MCKFNTKVDGGRDLYEPVEDNIVWLYDEAMEETALKARLDSLESPALNEPAFKPSESSPKDVKS